MVDAHIPPPPADSATLLAAYAAARYEVHAPGGVLRLEPGVPAPPALARALPASTWTLLTAWNPGSRPCPEVDNRHADARLQRQLDGLGLRRLPAVNSDASGAWREPGWLVADLGTPAADALARCYGQAGILHWPAASPVRLRMYLPGPATATGGAAPGWVDWVVASAG